jgi:hypothetical protein
MLRKRTTIGLVALATLMIAPLALGDNAADAKLHTNLLARLADEGVSNTWVYFTDKGVATDALDAAVADVAAKYNPRATWRRQVRSLAARRGEPIFTARDLPVAQDYIDAVVATGAEHNISSRWLNAISATMTLEQARAVAALPFVDRLEPVRRGRHIEPINTEPAAAPLAPEGPRTLDYGRSEPQLQQINLVALHDEGYTGQGVIVGILDTGFRRDHVAFNQPGHVVNVIAEYDFVDDDPDASNEPGDPSDQHRHGTLILGCLGAYKPGDLIGGAFDASFVLAKTEDTTGEYQAEEDKFVAGLEFIEQNGADMSTASLGYIDWYTQADMDGQTCVTSIACNIHTALGVHHCNAAGNEYHDSNPATSSLIAPADAFQVITCGAVTSTGSMASFSSDGPTADGRVKPEVLALGSGTDTVDPFSTTGYTTASGTSLSTPVVACAVACLVQARPYWTVDEMRQHLFENADYFVQNGTYDPLYVRGYGVIDAFATNDVCTDAGIALLDATRYACEDAIEITVSDCGLDLDPQQIDTVTVAIDSDSETGVEQVLLTELGTDAAAFAGTIPVSETNAAGVLLVAPGDTVTVTYIDEDNGQGQQVTVEATAVIDCTAPMISNVQTIDVAPRSAVVSFDADEPVQGIVYVGTDCGQLDIVASSTGFSTQPVVNVTGLQDNVTYYYSVEAQDEAGNVATDDNGGNCYLFTTPEVPDFFTELFASEFDLDGQKLTFIPAGTNDFYDACVEEITALPTDPAGGTTITLSDDDNELVNIGGGNEVFIYGAAYSGFYVGSNGYVTFGSGDTDYSETLEDHFDLPRISALFDDLHPGNGGTVSYKQLDDRIVVTWEEVPEYSNTGANTFQIEMFFDGTLTISYLGISASDGLAGLSEGVGLDPDYFPSDLSGLGACGPRPPTASAVEANTAISEPVAILLDASDDGLPDPPAALTYIIDSLPSSGTLTDPNGGEITGVPYTLLAGGNAVNYAPVPGTTAPDTFMYKANDGGVAPDGGDSNLAPVTITFGGPAWDPVAYDVTTGTAINSPIAVTLQADDPNGDPLTWHIASLPADGYLRTLDGTPIDSVPYTLPATEDAVRYLPPVGYNGVAMFDFYVTDFSATSNTATVTITVGGPSQILLVDLNEDPGWPMNGEWAFGVPQGLGGSAHGNPDPTGGYTGSNVLGVNLAGDYATTVGGPYFVTMGPIDLTDATEVELRFRRWLNSDYQPYASATVEVSTDGSNWTLLWENGGSPAVADSSWQAIALPATAADDAATVWFRWGYAVLQSGAFAYSGWNLDDIELWGLVPSAGILGDLNCDGVLSAADIDPFVLALTGGEAAYQAAYPDCYYLLADMNGDGAVSAADIDGFVQALTGGK